MSKRAILSVLSFSAFIIIVFIVIFLAQGYRIEKNGIYGTGILVVTSTPNGAAVKLNDQVVGATNTTINTLRPGTYSLSITKEGYFDWHKDVVIDKEKVTVIKALMAPVNPSLAPITSTPAQLTSLSPDGQKLVYTVPSGTSAGVWMLDLSSQPFNLARKPSQLAEDSPDLIFSQAQLEWSPSSKDLLMTINPQDPATSYIVSLDNPKQVRNIADTVTTLRNQWQQEKTTNLNELKGNFPKDIRTLIDANQATLAWSPDNLKFLYQEEQDGKYIYKIYDKETKKTTVAFEHSKQSFAVFRWFADSTDLILLEKDSLEATTGSVSVIGIDGTNKQQLYKGTLIGDTLYSYLNGSKVVILTSFNLQEATYYLYGINLQQ